MSRSRFLDASAPSRFVGRDRELNNLQEAWRRAKDGQRQVVFLSGEPGVGKTRPGCKRKGNSDISWTTYNLALTA